MERDEGQFTGRGGVRISWKIWLPDDRPRAVLLIAHGYGEHVGRYGNVVDAVVQRGYAVCAADHRGHGRSQGPRGHVGSFSEYISDLHSFRVRIGEKFRDAPVFLLGHSLGGLISVLYTLEHSATVDGLILSSPALGLASPPGALLRASAQLISTVAPTVSFSTSVVSTHLSHDSAVAKAYSVDPLVHSRASARFFSSFEAAIREAHERAAEIQLPLLVLQAGDDRLVRADETARFFAATSSRDCEMLRYEGFYHEIFNETDRDRVLSDLVRWLDARP